MDARQAGAGQAGARGIARLRQVGPVGWALVLLVLLAAGALGQAQQRETRALADALEQAKIRAEKVDVAALHAGPAYRTARSLLDAWMHDRASYRAGAFAIGEGLMRQVDRTEFMDTVLQELRRDRRLPGTAPPLLRNGVLALLGVLLVLGAAAWLLAGGAPGAGPRATAAGALRLLAPFAIGLALGLLGWL